MSDDPNGHVFKGALLKVLGYQGEMAARLGLAIVAAALLMMAFAGLISGHIVRGDSIGLVLSVSASGVGGVGQLLTADDDRWRWPTLVVAFGLAGASCARLVV